jgi:hypothetical protein
LLHSIAGQFQVARRRGFIAMFISRQMIVRHCCYRSAIVTSERVRMMRGTPPLPLDVATAVAGRVRWLRQELPAIDAELRLTYPPIEIFPVCWMNVLADGTSGFVPARVDVSAQQNCLVVQVSAAALLKYEDDLVRGVLGHEFLHVVYYTSKIAAHAASGDGSRVSVGVTDPAYDESWDGYHRADVAVQASPSEWLSERLRRLVARLDDEDDPAVFAAQRAILETWVTGGLPTEPAVARVGKASITLDPAIIDRANRLRSTSTTIARSKGVR